MSPLQKLQHKVMMLSRPLGGPGKALVKELAQRELEHKVAMEEASRPSDDLEARRLLACENYAL